MIAPLKPGTTLAQINGPVIETERLILRQWRSEDIAPNTAMLADPAAGRFITADGKPVTDEFVGWRNAAIMAGHWVLHGAGMFAVEEKSGFEVGWGIAKEFRGKGYALEAARASIGWTFANFELEEILHCIDCENIASQAVARRLGADKKGVMDLFGHAADIWVTKRSSWKG